MTDPYVWKSGNDDVVNKPLPLDDFPVIRRVMDKVNEQFGYELNSALVTCYARGTVNCSLHDDNEDTLDNTQPICVLSLGVKRKVEFVGKAKAHKYKSDLALEPKDSSIYIMKAGCQDEYLHRVRRDKNIRDKRISISFRCFIPQSAIPQSTKKDNTPFVPSTPIKCAVKNTAFPPNKLTDSGTSPFPTGNNVGNYPSQGEDTFNTGISHSSSKSTHESICLLFARL